MQFFFVSVAVASAPDVNAAIAVVASKAASTTAEVVVAVGIANAVEVVRVAAVAASVVEVDAVSLSQNSSPLPEYGRWNRAVDAGMSKPTRVRSSSSLPSIVAVDFDDVVVINVDDVVVVDVDEVVVDVDDVIGVEVVVAAPSRLSPPPLRFTTMRS